MYNITEKEERQYLATIIEKLDDAIDQVDENVSRYSRELQEHKNYLWENKTGMDAAEKGSMRESITSKAISGEAAVALKARLRKLMKSPYFGRIDFTEEYPHSTDAEPVYIGIYSFHDEELNKNLIHDWRAPIAGMFYDYELGKAEFEAPSGQKSGEITRKRQYRIQDGHMEMMLESEMQIRDDILQEELSRAADDKMKNIVATIQRDQNAIIRNETSPVLIIQGVAGSGKTSIALHRIAFLLYRFKDTLSAEDLLIISPNKVFADYISNVLPELGEDTIPEMGIEGLAMELLEGKFTFQSFFEQVTRLLQRSDEAFVERMRFKAGYDFLTQLNKYINYLEKENFVANDLQIRRSFVPARYVRERYLSYRHRPMFKRLTEVVRDVTDKVRKDFRYDLKAAEKNKLRSDIKKMFRNTNLRAIYKAFYEWLERPDMFKYATRSTFEYADVYPLIYLKMHLEGGMSYHRVKHLLVDEMQDYTPVQYAVLSKLFTCNKTILGDANQSVNPYSSTNSEEIQRVFPKADAVKLNKSYRSTWEITRFAQQISPNEDLEAVERHGQEPEIRNFKRPDDEIAAIFEQITHFIESGHQTMGVICKTQKQADKLYEELTHYISHAEANGLSNGPRNNGNKQERDHTTGISVHLISSGSTTLSSGVNITTAHLAKGLEFDEVIVPGVTAKNYATPIDKSMLYIACTRAMHRLTLTHTGQLSSFLIE